MKSRDAYPQLRFKGFDDAWEQRKLGNISDKVKEKNKFAELTETLTNSAEYGIISQRDFFDKDISNVKNLDGYYVVKNDDFVYNPRISNFAPVGPIKRNKLGRTGIMSPLYYVFRTYSIDKNYLEKHFDAVYWHRFMELNGDSGARADRFAIKDSVFVEMPIPYPTLKEQAKIGTFFQQLDNLITLHQRKLTKLKELKQGYLQKLFLKNGSKFPQLRFSGFTNAWEQRKLGDVDSIAMNRRIFKEQTSEDGDIPFYKIGIFGGQPDAFITRDLFEEYKRKYSYPKVRDLLISASGNIGRIIEYTGKNEYFQDSNTVWLDHGPQLDNSFLKHYLIVKWDGIEGTTIKWLYNKIILNTKIALPSLPEQKQIGSFFGKLDSIITFHQRKLEKLQELKKGYLQKMFC